MKISLENAQSLHRRLPPQLRMATLSPEYVLADASRMPEAEVVFWCYEENDHFWYHGFHLIPLPGVPGFDAQSPYGYGGPLANSSDPRFLARAWKAYTQSMKVQDIVAEFVRFHPLAGNATFYGGRISHDRPTVWLDLLPDEPSAGYQARVRTAVRKAEKSGVHFRWGSSDDIVYRFGGFYRTAMAAVSAASFYFFDDEYFARIASLPCARLGLCTLDEEWLSAALFLCDGDCVEYHLAASSTAGKQLSASNLLLHAVAVAARGEGYQRLYLGGGTDARPDNPLLFFKAGFSDLRADFCVGTTCYDEARYEALRRRWPQQFAQNPDKLLFYR